MLSKDEDVTLVDRIQRDKCNSSIKKLIEKHSKLYYSICNKYVPSVSLQEYYLDKDYVIYKSVLTFSSTKKTKFSTWLGNMTRYHCLNKRKKDYKYVLLEEKDLNYFIDNSVLVDYDSSSPEDRIHQIFEILDGLRDKRITKIFKMRYFSGTPKITWKEIAKEFNLTPQTVINLHKKGKNLIRKKMEKQVDMPKVTTYD